MKKNLLLTLMLIAFFTSTATASSICNLGTVYASDVNITADRYENRSLIKASNKVNIDADILTGSGSITANCANIKCNTYDLNGTLSCSKDCIIKAKIFGTNGRIEGNKASITCDEFKFTGDILAQECVIYAKNAFDYTMFKRNPEGKYTVIIAKYGFESYTYDSLLSSAISTFINYCLFLDEKNIENEIKKIRSYAALNNIDDLKLVIALKKAIEESFNYNKERIHEKYGSYNDLGCAIICGTAGAGLLAGGIAIIRHTKPFANLNNGGELNLQCAVVAIISSGIVFCVSYAGFSEWFNPQYKEKYEKLLLINSIVNQALITPRIPEEEIIILQQ